MALPWEEDYSKQPSEQEDAAPWEQDYSTQESSATTSDASDPFFSYPDAVRQEEDEWETFWHSYHKSKGLTEATAQWFDANVMPLGRIQITDPKTGEVKIEYQPPSKELQEAVKRGDDELANALINAQRNQRLQDMYPTLYTPEGIQRENTENLAGTLVGYIADPTSLIPFAAGWKGAAASGAAFGGVDSYMHHAAKDGKVDFGDVLLGSALGAAIPTGLKGVGKAFGKHDWKDSVGSARKVLDRYDREVLKDIQKGIPLDMAQYSAAMRVGIKGGYPEVVRASEKAGRPLVNYKGSTPEKAADVLEQIELSARKNWFNKNGYLKQTAEFIGDYITPISTRIKNISPRLFHGLRKMDLETHVKVHERMEEAKPWFDYINKLRKSDSVESDKLKKAILGEDFKRAYGLIGKYEGTSVQFQGMREAFNGMRKMMDKMADEAIDMGYEIDKIASYYPKIVRHPEGLGVVRKSLIANRLAEAAKKKGRELSGAERRAIIENTIKGHSKTAAKTANNLRERQYRFMLDDMLPHYADLDEAMAGYIREMTHTVQRQKFLKANATPSTRKGGLPETPKIKGEMVEDSVAAVLDKERRRLNLTPDQEDKLTKMLVSRFGAGERAPRGGLRTFKNITYGATLGNIISAITQLGDNAFGMFMHGVRPHMRALVDNLKGSKLIPGKRADDFVEKTLIGLTEITEDIMTDTSKSKKFVDTMLKWSGFSKMDKFGKENLINGALNKAKRQVKSDKGRAEFIGKWGPYFEGQTYSLLKKIEKGDVTDENVKLFLWHSLSDAQPIGLSEMPEGYLAHPNGRVFYMLKTFTIKQLDLMRREIWDDLAAGNTGKAAQKMAMFTTLFMTWNGGAEAMKDLLKGKDVEIPDIAVNNMIKVTGLSRWETDKFGRNGPLETISQMIIPPYPIDDVYKGIAKADPAQAARALPYVGFLSGWAKD